MKVHCILWLKVKEIHDMRKAVWMSEFGWHFGTGGHYRQLMFGNSPKTCSSINIVNSVVFLISGTCVNTFLRKNIFKKYHVNNMIAQPNSCSHDHFKL